MKPETKHDEKEEDGQNELDEMGGVGLHLVIATPHGSYQYGGEGDKEKADYFIPERVERLHHGWNDSLQELMGFRRHRQKVDSFMVAAESLTPIRRVADRDSGHRRGTGPYFGCYSESDRERGLAWKID